MWLNNVIGVFPYFPHYLSPLSPQGAPTDNCQVHGPPTRKMTSQSTAMCFFAVSQMVPNLNTNTYQTHHKSTLKFHVEFHVQLRKIKPCHVRRPHLVLGVRQPGQLWPWAHLGPASESTFMQVLSKKWCGAWGMGVLG